jgi:hypothetical protein
VKLGIGFLLTTVPPSRERSLSLIASRPVRSSVDGLRLVSLGVQTEHVFVPLKVKSAHQRCRYENLEIGVIRLLNTHMLGHENPCSVSIAQGWKLIGIAKF